MGIWGNLTSGIGKQLHDVLMIGDKVEKNDGTVGEIVSKGDQKITVHFRDGCEEDSSPTAFGQTLKFHSAHSLAGPGKPKFGNVNILVFVFSITPVTFFVMYGLACVVSLMTKGVLDGNGDILLSMASVCIIVLFRAITRRKLLDVESNIIQNVAFLFYQMSLFIANDEQNANSSVNIAEMLKNTSKQQIFFFFLWLIYASLTLYEWTIYMQDDLFRKGAHGQIIDVMQSVLEALVGISCMGSMNTVQVCASFIIFVKIYVDNFWN